MIISLLIYVFSLVLVVINFVLPDWSLPAVFIQALQGLIDSTYWLNQFFPVQTLFYCLGIILLFEISYFIMRLFLHKRLPE